MAAFLLLPSSDPLSPSFPLALDLNRIFDTTLVFPPSVAFSDSRGSPTLFRWSTVYSIVAKTTLVSSGFGLSGWNVGYILTLIVSSNTGNLAIHPRLLFLPRLVFLNVQRWQKK